MLPGGIQKSEGLDTDEVVVISHGIPRSGSTWVYQILCDICTKGSVWKTHFYLVPAARPSMPVISTYRDMRDCAVSHWRQGYPDRTSMTTEEVFRYAGMAQHSTWALDQYATRRGAALIRYEDAILDPELIFDVIQKHLGVGVPLERRVEILAARSIAENRRKVADGTGQKDALVTNHVHEGQVGTWRRFVPDPDLLTELLQPLLDRWGYPL